MDRRDRSWKGDNRSGAKCPKLGITFVQSVVNKNIKAPVKPVRSDDLIRNLCRWLLQELLLSVPHWAGSMGPGNSDPKPLGVNLHLLGIMLRLSGIKHFLGSKCFLGTSACITVLLILHICTGRKQKDLRSLSLSKCAGIDPYRVLWPAQPVVNIWKNTVAQSLLFSY